MLRDKSPERCGGYRFGDGRNDLWRNYIKEEHRRQPKELHAIFSADETSGQRSYRGHGKWKTSIVFSTANTPGSLFKSMACLALRDLNLTKIESRPLPGKPLGVPVLRGFSGLASGKTVERALRQT